MRRIKALFILAFSLLTFVAGAQTAKKINYAKEGYVKAKVIKYDVDGCGFLIELANKEKTKLSPDSLGADFKKDGQKVWLKYSPSKKKHIGTCMAGDPVFVHAIKKRK